MLRMQTEASGVITEAHRRLRY